MKCPIRFYFDTILRLKEEAYSTDYNDEEFLEDRIVIKKDIEEYDSKDALYIGNLIHRYMEKHTFGHSFNIDLFDYVKKKGKTGRMQYWPLYR